MSIINHQQAELLTRQAAAAIDKHVAHWFYDRSLLGLKETDTAFLGSTETFAPLRILSDALIVEVALHVNIMYEPQENGTMLLRLSRSDLGGSMVTGITKYQDPMRERMESVVKFAALCASMDGKLKR